MLVTLLSLVLNSIRHFLVLELVQKLHQEERKLELVLCLIEEVLNAGVLDANIDEVFSGDLGAIVNHLVQVLLHRKHVIEVHARYLKTLLVGDHDRSDVLIRRQLGDQDSQLLFGKRAHIQVVKEVFEWVCLREERVEKIHLGAGLAMLLRRCQQVETGLINHRLLLVLELEPVDDRLVQSGRLFLHCEAVCVDVLNRAQQCLQVLPLWPNRLRVPWIQYLGEIFELRLEVDLKLCRTRGVHNLSS